MRPSEPTGLKGTLFPPCCVSYFDCRLCFRCRRACAVCVGWCSGGSVIAPLPGLGQTALVINQYSRDGTEGFVTEPSSLECKQRTFCKASTYLAAPPSHNSAHLPLFLRSPGGGAVRVHLITCDPSVCCNLCLQTQSPSAEFIAQAPLGQPARLHTREACGILNLFFFSFPIPLLSLCFSSTESR